MRSDGNNALRITPIILAGGLGTRLRPRTNYLPKPLLPISGRPLLWYTLRTASASGFGKPIVCLDYLAECIKAYFADSEVTFVQEEHKSMADAFLSVAAAASADAFACLSADVILGPHAAGVALDAFRAGGMLDTLLITRLDVPGHKKWEFRIHDGRLTNLEVATEKTRNERVMLILRKDSVIRVKNYLPSPVVEADLPAELRKFQSGWNLILRALLDCNIPVHAKIVDVPVFNLNVPTDFSQAERFIREKSFSV